VDSDAGSLTVARQLPLAEGRVTAIAAVPPVLWLPLGQLTLRVRYVGPDQTTDIVVGPFPAKAKPLERCCGGFRNPSVCVRPLVDETAAAVVVVVAGATVVVVTLGGAVAGVISPRTGGEDSNDVVGLVVSAVAGPAVVVVVSGDCRGSLVDSFEVAGVGGREECCGSAGASATPCRCLAGRAVLPAVATSRAMRANDTARITHQVGRSRTARARPALVVPAPPSATGTPYARVMRAAPGGQAHRLRRPR
jgi:hypothetical protein